MPIAGCRSPRWRSPGGGCPDGGRVEEAEGLVEEALPAVREVGDLLAEAKLAVLSGQLARVSGRDEIAREQFLRSLGLCQELGDKLGLALALEGLAGLAAAAGDGERAARLLGGTEPLRALTHTYIPRVWLDLYDGDVELARHLLGEKRFEAAWDDGLRLTLGQVIDLGRGEAVTVAAFR